MAKVASKQKRIDDIVALLESGMQNRDIILKCTNLYNCSIPAIHKYIKEAKIIIKERKDAMEAIRVSTISENLKDAVNEAILSDLEIEAILCKIAAGRMTVEEMFQGEPVLREITPNEIIQAARTLYAKRGSNAPTKTALTDTKGNDIKQDYSRLSDEELNSLSVLQKKVLIG